MLDVLGIPESDYWLLYLDDEEYQEYRLYKKALKMFDEDRVEETMKILDQLVNGKLSVNPLLTKSIKHMKLTADFYFDKNSEKNYDLILEKLFELLDIPDFEIDMIPNKVFNSAELKILNHIAGVYSAKGNRKEAINIFRKIYNNLDNFKITVEDYNKIVPLILTNLSKSLLIDKKLDEAKIFAVKALRESKKNEVYWLVPTILSILAEISKMQFDNVEIYAKLLTEAYYCAKAIGRINLARHIYKRSSEYFGIDITKK